MTTLAPGTKRRPGRPPERQRWPIADLMAAVNCHTVRGLSARIDGRFDNWREQRDTATYRTLLRSRETGLTTVMADRYALELGLHPALVWTDWYDIEEAS